MYISVSVLKLSSLFGYWMSLWAFLKSFYECVSTTEYQSEYIIHKDIMFDWIDVNIEIYNHASSSDIIYMEFYNLYTL